MARHDWRWRLSPEDGWLDPNSVLQGFRKKAVAMGTGSRAIGRRRHTSGPRVTELELASGAVSEPMGSSTRPVLGAIHRKLAGMDLP